MLKQTFVNHKLHNLYSTKLDRDGVFINQAVCIKNKHLFYQDNRRISKVCIVVTLLIIQYPVLLEETGADTFLHKPFDTEVLKKLLIIVAL
jgi:hypothetical protein